MATNSRRPLSGNIATRILVDTKLQFETSFIMHGVCLKERKAVNRKMLLTSIDLLSSFTPTNFLLSITPLGFYFSGISPPRRAS